MRIVFTTDDFGDEAASLEAAAAGRPPAEETHLYGAVVLEPDGGPALRVYDDLPFLVQSLCAEAPAALRRDGSARVDLVDAPNTLTLTREGETVSLRGELGEAAAFPVAGLLQALPACAERFADFLDALVRTAPQFETRARWLREALARPGQERASGQ